MKVSIITVCYNAEKTIEQTIDSVLNQTYPNLEYIVIDGKSEDDTLDIVNKYKDRITKIVSEPDNGIYDAMNKGIKMATGEIIGIINADDWYEKNAVEIMVNAFESLDVNIIYGALNVIEEERVINTIRYEPIEEMWYKTTVQHPSTFVRREFYEKFGLYDTTMQIASDYDFLLRAYCEGVSIRYIDSVIANFRNNGISNTKVMKGAEETIEIVLKYIDKCPDKKRVYLKNTERLNIAKFKELSKVNPELIKAVLDDYFGHEINTVSIMGTGKWGKDIVELLHECKVEIEVCYDNEPSKWGKKFSGINVQNPVQLSDKKADVIIAIRNSTEEIESQFKKYGNSGLRWIVMYDLMKKVVECYDKTS